jgi:hypothetical protein
MDGKKYFEMKASVPVGDHVIHGARGSFGSVLATANDGFLYEQLEALYAHQDVHFLTDDTPTVSLDLANDNAAAHAISTFGMSKALSNSFGPNRYALSSKTAKRRSIDSSDELEDTEIMRELHASFTDERSLLSDVSSLVIGSAVRGLYRERARIATGKIDAPGVVNSAVRENRKLLLEGLDTAVRVDVTKIIGSDEAEVEAKSISPHVPVPKWLKNTNEWNATLQFRVAQGLLEIDTFAALTQWCFERKLGALVIPAPSKIENGLPLSNGKNANADMLVASLVENKIVPVQVKNRSHHLDDADYIDEMVMVTPSRIGLVDPTSRIQRVNGHMHTVNASTTHYGSHASLLHADLSGKIRKGTHDAEQARLAKAFAFFDYKVLPQLVA